MNNRVLNNRDFCTVAQLAEFDAVIDVRSPAEFAEDHVPGAINCPVLDNDERARVGTIYTQVSPFEARKIGAVLVARNIARHVESLFQDRPKHWRPLVYCWRGGQRSGAFTHVLQQVGWAAKRLEGGYKSWRRHVLAEIETLPRRLKFRVIAGPTGSGKSRLLEALAAQGAQILHLEALAAHKGSVLGSLPDAPQPSQKMFETRLYAQLAALSPERPTFVEAESRRIGQITLPGSMIDAIRSSPCLRVQAGMAARVAFLLRDYDYFLDATRLQGQLALLKGLQSRETIHRWQAMAARGEFRTLVAELLQQHYDPLYARSQRRSYSGFDDAHRFETTDLDPPGLARLAGEVILRCGQA